MRPLSVLRGFFVLLVVLTAGCIQDHPATASPSLPAAKSDSSQPPAPDLVVNDTWTVAYVEGKGVSQGGTRTAVEWKELSHPLHVTFYANATTAGPLPIRIELYHDGAKVGTKDGSSPLVYSTMVEKTGRYTYVLSSPDGLLAGSYTVQAWASFA